MRLDIGMQENQGAKNERHLTVGLVFRISQSEDSIYLAGMMISQPCLKYVVHGSFIKCSCYGLKISSKIPRTNPWSPIWQCWEMVPNNRRSLGLVSLSLGMDWCPDLGSGFITLGLVHYMTSLPPSCFLPTSLWLSTMRQCKREVHARHHLLHLGLPSLQGGELNIYNSCHCKLPYQWYRAVHKEPRQWSVKTSWSSV